MNVRAVFISVLTLFAAGLFIQSCDTGLEPPPLPPTGTIVGTVEYEGEWPPEDELFDLRFVAFKTPPSSILDLLDVDNMIFSDRLEFNVDQDTFRIEDVQNDTFRYSVIAQKFGQNDTDWRAVGEYTDHDGVFTVEGDIVEISIRVDFDDPPPFPPE